MLIQAMDSFIIASRAHTENVKAQYTDKNGTNNEVTYFRASGLGDADRKQIYKFFAHNLPKKPKSAKNLRQLANGDGVHYRYQTAWKDMGVLISMEERLSSKDDEYLSQFEWELAGHYDGLLDVNILQAHAKGLATLESFYNEESGAWEIDVIIDPDYGLSIGLFDEEGNIREDYEPITMVADIKTMNPWGFKAIKEKADISNITGYVDQIMKYMYDLNTPYGSIFIEAKDSNDVVEVQVLWTDLHNTEDDPYIYEWDEHIHGEKRDDIVRVAVNMERFFGSDTVEGVVPRLTRLWDLKKAIVEADESGDFAKMQEIFPIRCSEEPNSFPCSWGHKKGEVQYCEFFDHCWNKKTGGVGIRQYEGVPAEFIWEFEDDNGIIKVDKRLVPEGIDQDAFATLVGMGGLVLDKFVIKDDYTEDTSEEENYEETALNEDNLFSAEGELNLFAPTVGDGAPSEAIEYTNEKGQKAIDCLNCGKQNTYQKLANGGTKKCNYCKHVNKVSRGE